VKPSISVMLPSFINIIRKSLKDPARKKGLILLKGSVRLGRTECYEAARDP